MYTPRSILVFVAAFSLWALAAGATAQDSRDHIQRMGAFQCIVCPSGGFVEGARDGFGRVHVRFGSFRTLCIASYVYLERELYVRFLLDGKPWPDDGAWKVKASSWNAECRVSAEIR